MAALKSSKWSSYFRQQKKILLVKLCCWTKKLSSSPGTFKLIASAKKSDTIFVLAHESDTIQKNENNFKNKPIDKN